SADGLAVAGTSGAPGGPASPGGGAAGRPDARPVAAGAGTAGTSEGPQALEEDGALRVEVQAQKAPLPGARVRIYRRGSRDPNTNHVAWTPAGAARTGADGTASFRASPGRYVAVAEAD